MPDPRAPRTAAEDPMDIPDWIAGGCLVASFCFVPGLILAGLAYVFFFHTGA